MSSRIQLVLLERWSGYAVGLAAVALISSLIGLVLSFKAVANLSMLYLIAVMGIAIVFGRGPAVFASLAAFLSFDWFFVSPPHTFSVADPAEWIALLLFLLTAVITGQLAASQRQRAEEAEHRKRDAVVLYDVVRLMSEPDLDHALQAVCERLYQELGVAGVSIEVTDQAGVVDRAIAADEGEDSIFRVGPGVATETLGEGLPPTAVRRGAPARWIRIVPPNLPGAGKTGATDRLYKVHVRSQSRRVGNLLLARRAGARKFTVEDDRLLSAVATQLGLAVERVALQREATEAEILRRADQLKTALLNAVSHDLRTPLASIITSAGSLRQGEVIWTDEERQEMALAIEEEALRLNQIVGNLLDLSRMEGGSLKPEKGWYDIGALVDDVLGRLRPLLEKHRLVVDVSDDLPPVLLDYVEIDQVISNLIENATKYTQPGTEVTVSAGKAGDELRIEVADRGSGFPPDAILRLFEPFYRVSGQGPRPKGTGLGLAVAKGLVEAHGGRIWAENRQGGGARFIVSLPLLDPNEAFTEPNAMPS
ncbi:MAG: DUF4118 domain-containing protein [Dehalococcoidia bacterium]|nr:DUF4118 domain-containing protein [Dehalococcoidia bacterium]